VDPHCFDADPDPAQNLDADLDPDPDPGGEGWGRSAKNVHPPWQNPRYAPACPYATLALWIRIDFNADPNLAFQVNSEPVSDPDPGF
jgi:hypothetical protein